MVVNNKGSIVAKLFTAVERHPSLSMAEIFQSFLGKKALGKHFFNATEEEIYTSLEKFCDEKEETDEPFDEAGWTFFMQKILTER